MQNTLTILLLLFIDAKTERKLGRHLRNEPKPDPACSQHEASAQHQQLLRGTLNSVRGKENPKIDEVPAWPSPEWCRNTEIESEDGLAAGWPGPGPGWRGGAPAALLSRSRALQLTFSRPLQPEFFHFYIDTSCTLLTCLAVMWHVVLRIFANFSLKFPWEWPSHLCSGHATQTWQHNQLSFWWLDPDLC